MLDVDATTGATTVAELLTTGATTVEELLTTATGDAVELTGVASVTLAVEVTDATGVDAATTVVVPGAWIWPWEGQSVFAYGHLDSRCFRSALIAPTSSL